MRGIAAMNTKEKSMVSDFSIGWLIDLIVLTSLISLLIIPSALASEAQGPAASTATEQVQPVVSAAAAPEPEKAMTQALDSYAAGNSINFLMESSPLAGSVPTQAGASVSTPGSATPAAANPVPVTLQVLEGTVLQRTDEVAMLVSEQCSQNGAAAEGSNSCERVYSNGHHATVLTQNANEGDELKHQTVIEEFDEDNTLLYRKTIRHREDFNYLGGQKTKEKDLFDITYQPAGKKVTRELMVYEYFLGTGKAKSLSWTQYEQIGNESKAGLVYHALLRFDQDGNPDRGVADRWDRGEKTATYMDWNRHSQGYATLDLETWKEWEGWIRNVSMQAYLP